MPTQYLHKDPFPNIAPSLLNSADIEDYVIKTGMIDPFCPEKLKPASYEVGFEGIVYFWDEDGEPHKIDTAIEKIFTLPKNSIAFLFTKVKFSLPDYIALRFNLKITHVHRGILLGTGPLIDPGFEGNLLIPIHNLTTNNYVFNDGEGLIWVEFTKLSKNELWTEIDRGPERTGQYKEFPQDKKNKNAEYYFGKAAMGKAIRSSIPDAMKQTAEDAKEASTSVKKAEATVKLYTWTGLIGTFIAVIAICVSLYIGFTPILQTVNESVRYVKDEKKYYDEKGTKILDEINKLRTEIDKLNKRVDEIIESEKVNLEVNNERIKAVERKIDDLSNIEKKAKSKSK